MTKNDMCHSACHFHSTQGPDKNDATLFAREPKSHCIFLQYPDTVKRRDISILSAEGCLCLHG